VRQRFRRWRGSRRPARCPRPLPAGLAACGRRAGRPARPSDFVKHAAEKLAAIGDLDLPALRRQWRCTSRPKRGAISPAPLNSERRDTSVSGTRAVVSSQQLTMSHRSAPEAMKTHPAAAVARSFSGSAGGGVAGRASEVPAGACRITVAPSFANSMPRPGSVPNMRFTASR
jgi:hypothetical protein